jgi:hypothetical protein
MMKDEFKEFERRVSNQPLKQVPGEWRAEILAAVAADANRRHEVSREFTFAATVGSWLSTILWPHPKAWAGLATVWMLILALNLSMHERGPVPEAKAAAPTQAVMAELRQQHKLYAELIGTTDPRDADRQPLLRPRPRSERAEALAA